MKCIRQISVLFIACSMLAGCSASKASEAESDKQETEIEAEKEEELNDSEISEIEEAEEEFSLEDIPFQAVDDYKVSFMTDYAHASNEIVYLGNDEGAEFTVTAQPAGLTADDFFFYADEAMLKCTVTDVIDDPDINRTIIRWRVEGIAEGLSEIYIFSNYDYIVLGDDCSIVSCSIRKLDSADGRVVYVTDNGDKYHYSEACAGENAVKTTLMDAESLEYEPCSKCTN